MKRNRRHMITLWLSASESKSQQLLGIVPTHNAIFVLSFKGKVLAQITLKTTYLWENSEMCTQIIVPII